MEFYTANDDSLVYKRDTILISTNKNCVRKYYGEYREQFDITIGKHGLILVGGSKSSVSWVEVMMIIHTRNPFRPTYLRPRYRIFSRGEKTFIRIQREDKPDELYLFYKIQFAQCSMNQKPAYSFTIVRIKGKCCPEKTKWLEMPKKCHYVDSYGSVPYTDIKFITTDAKGEYTGNPR